MSLSDLVLADNADSGFDEPSCASSGACALDSACALDGSCAPNGSCAVPPDDERRRSSRRAYDQRLRDLNVIGLALSSERDIQKLLELILTKARELTQADAGSLYLVERDVDGESQLLFHSAQNDSIAFDTANRRMKVSRSSLAGYVALSGETLCFDDVYDLPSDAPYSFSPAFDREHGYFTRSVLVMPLSNYAGDVVGVLQLINRKRHRETPLRDLPTVEREVLSFDPELVDLARSLASQAAVALENNRLLAEVQKLLDDISDLFDSFVMASADAIESRDPSTSGHSKRVTTLTVGLAMAANEATEGPFKDVFYTPAQLREIRYAALLHDFGKIGVRENVLLKARKIEDAHFSSVLSRVELLRYHHEAQAACREVELLRRALEGAPREEIEAQIEENQRQRDAQRGELDRVRALLRDANVSDMVPLDFETWQTRQKELQALEAVRYPDENGHWQPLLTSDEVRALCVRRGTLTPDEFQQIQKHSSFSFNFLKQIPWTDDLQQIPEIAHCHHEKLDGTGYPRGLHAEEIPLPSRMMTVSDIYDALTSAERPYKRAMTRREALRILQDEADAGALDADVVELFISRKIHKLTEGWNGSTLA